MPVTEVTWVRYLGNFLLLLPFTLHYHGLRGFLPGCFIAQLFRGLVLVLTTYLFFTAIQTVPIADAQIVFFINPLLVVVLAAKGEIGFQPGCCSDGGICRSVSGDPTRIQRISDRNPLCTLCSDFFCGLLNQYTYPFSNRIHLDYTIF